MQPKSQEPRAETAAEEEARVLAKLKGMKSTEEHPKEDSE
jgi:hypothetical protein